MKNNPLVAEEQHLRSRALCGFTGPLAVTHLRADAGGGETEVRLQMRPLLAWRHRRKEDFTEKSDNGDAGLREPLASVGTAVSETLSQLPSHF